MSLLKEYYDSIAAENAAKANAANAQAQQTHAQTTEIGANAASTRALQGAQAGAAGAQGALAGQQAGQVGADASSNRALNSARAGQDDANTAAIGSTTAADNALKSAQTGLVRQNIQAGTVNLPNLGIGGLGGGGLVPDTPGPFDPKAQGFERGGKVKAVPGKGKPGPTDTVPTMLTPGEGVLNKGAVEHYGLATLHHMNAMGLKRMGAQSEVAQHMGLPDPHAAPGKAADGKVTEGGVKGKAAGDAPPSKRKGYATGGVVTPGATANDVLAMFAMPRSPTTGGMPAATAQGLTPLTRETTGAQETPRR